MGSHKVHHRLAFSTQNIFCHPFSHRFVILYFICEIPTMNSKRSLLLSIVFALAASPQVTASAPFAVKSLGSIKKRDVKESSSALLIPRGGDGAGKMAVAATNGLKEYINGPKSDALLLLTTTALNTPLCKKLGASPILGFLALGLLFGPKGFSLVKDIHTTEMLADFGVVFFLFEMGIHLSFDTLMKMKRDVFGLGMTQFGVTALAVAGVAAYCGLDTGAQIVLGGGLALSSSAFVLQLLKDKNQLETEYGKKSFAVLLMQDLMVVPLLVVIPILAGGGEGIGGAIASALVRVSMALAAIALAGKFLLNPLFDAVANAGSQEAFVGCILATVLGMSFLTEGLGLSNTLGAFLAGVLLADTKHRHHIEKEMNPIRGILVGIFFFSVGFEIDLNLIKNKFPLVASIVLGITALKAALATGACLAFDVEMPTAQRIGLVLSQGGEFAFVAFRMACSHGILDDDLKKLMLTCVSLTMALTPMLENFGSERAAAAAAVTVGDKKKKRKVM
jgi:CPA2 family monovalent cation:H+ antiporter-2